MKKISIALAILVRQEKVVTLEVPDNFDKGDDDLKRELMSQIYEMDDGAGFTDDNSWGCEEATHQLLGDSDKDPDYRLKKDGVIEKVGGDYEGDT